MIQNIDRVPVHPNRKLITPEGGGAPFYATVEYADNPSEAGKPINKAALDEFLAASGTTAGTGDALTLVQAGFVLADGATVRFKLHAAMNKGATLNVNATGAHALVDGLGKPQKAIAGSYCTAIYSSTNGNFILQGSGGAKPRFGNEPGQISTYEFILKGASFNGYGGI